jgi:hypothetical protein
VRDVGCVDGRSVDGDVDANADVAVELMRMLPELVSENHSSFIDAQLECLLQQFKNIPQLRQYRYARRAPRGTSIDDMFSRSSLAEGGCTDSTTLAAEVNQPHGDPEAQITTISPFLIIELPKARLQACSERCLMTTLGVR